MRLYVYADESGAFDKMHNDIFVYGGLVVPGKDAKDNLERRYLAVERDIVKHSSKLKEHDEAKACHLNMKERKRLYRLVSKEECIQFGVIINQQLLHDAVFATKQTKQRYLDWALKMGVRKGIERLLVQNPTLKDNINNVTVIVDEHSSSTDGRYNLHESIDEELRIGTYNPDYGIYHKPVFGKSISPVKVSYVDSRKVTLIRAADITANWIYRASLDRDSLPSELQVVNKSAVLYWHPSAL